MSLIEKNFVERNWIRCNACGADAVEELIKADGDTVGRCSMCSLIYVNPMPFFKKSNYQDIANNCYYTKFQREITTGKVEFRKRQLRSQFEEIVRITPR